MALAADGWGQIMGVIILKLAGSLQSWGDDSRYSERKTRHEPTKSGVIGLLAAALGRCREDPIDDLACLRVGVRTDQPGSLERDYQTVRRTHWNTEKRIRERGTRPEDSYVTRRYYLADAIFVVGIEVPDELLATYEDALDHPVFPLFLGRRSCPPSCRVFLGSREDVSLADALADVPWQATSRSLIRRHLQDERVLLEVSLDEACLEGEAATYTENVHDQPVSFSQLYRQYEWRRATRKRLQVPNPHCIGPVDEHDPFSALGKGV